MPKYLQIIFIWTAIWLFWVWFAQHHHPTWQLNMLASGVLVAASALAVQWGRPHGDGMKPRSWIEVFFHLAVRIIALAIVVVLIIQFFYDRLWGPDPARYSFAVNLLMDTAFIAVHYSLASLCVAANRRMR